MTLGTAHAMVSPSRPVTAGMTGKALSSSKPGPNGFRPSKSTTGERDRFAPSSSRPSTAVTSGNQPSMSPTPSVVPSGLLQSLFEKGAKSKLLYELELPMKRVTSTLSTATPPVVDNTTVVEPEDEFTIPAALQGSQIQPLQRPATSSAPPKKPSTLYQPTPATKVKQPIIAYEMVSPQQDETHSDEPDAKLHGNSALYSPAFDEDEPAFYSSIIHSPTRKGVEVDPYESCFNGDLGGWDAEEPDEGVAAILGSGIERGAIYQYISSYSENASSNVLSTQGEN
ncbi:hypothetical protein HDV05_007134, partial [Chytridiales sp. JEL 0842]